VKWYEESPERLQRELAALGAAGLDFVVNDAARQERGVIEIVVTTQLEAEQCTLVATYPDEFPYFKPLVRGPDLGYRHHVNPTTGEFCLLQAGQGVWVPSDTLAWLLTVQLDHLVAANSPGAELSTVIGIEMAQAEPFSCYFTLSKPDEHIIVDSALDGGKATSGWARLIYTSRDPLRGHVVELLGSDGATLSGPVRGPLLTDLTLGAVQIRWVQLSSPPTGTAVNDWWDAALEADPALATTSQGLPGRATLTVAKALQFVLVGFPEEVGHRQLGQGWVALVRRRDKRTKPWRGAHIIRVERAGRRDLFVREPRLSAMADANVLVVGLGGIGSEVAGLLACLVPNSLQLIDGDSASPVTAIRNRGAFAALDWRKASTLFTRLTPPSRTRNSVGFSTSSGSRDWSVRLTPQVLRLPRESRKSGNSSPG